MGGVRLGPAFSDLWADRHEGWREGKVRMTSEIGVRAGCEDKVYICKVEEEVPEKDGACPDGTFRRQSGL